MTTVLAVARWGAVVMGGDSATNVYDRPVLGARKVRRFTTRTGVDFLIGFAGDGAMPGLLERSLTVEGVPLADDPVDLQKWADAIAEAITDIARDAGCVEAGKFDSTLILGFAGRLWSITHRQAIPHEDGVAAVGSGEGPAIGAADALLERAAISGRNRSREDLADIVQTAVHIAIKRDRYSDGRVLLEILDPPVVEDEPARLEPPYVFAEV